MIAILQPFVPHYREDFFNGLIDRLETDIYCYETSSEISRNKFRKGDINVKQIKKIKIGPVVLVSPFHFLKKKYSTVVLMLTFSHISTWILLFTRPIHRKKVFLMGHGISVKRFIKEEKKPNILLKWMIALSDGAWFYTEHELNIWRKIFPKSNLVALNNTISDVNKILSARTRSREEIKALYNISQPRIFIFCARFVEPAKRFDILVKAVDALDKNKFGFIIIGDGNLKPDFKNYKNVYDFGALYDRQLKNDLFHAADIYFQPAWVGLSIVEAMAYGKPIFTFKRSKNLLQCVEYSYVKNGYNGIIFETLQDFFEESTSITDEQIAAMGNNSERFATNELKIEAMVSKAYNNLIKEDRNLVPIS
ncbi:MAG: glycosyltransferase [Chitinophagaceae bacterium]